MIYEPVIGIDFGATYTKIACRQQLEGVFDDPHQLPEGLPELARQARINRRSRSLQIDNEFLIPSCIIRNIGNDKEFDFGESAALRNPGKPYRLYSNWKSELFREDGKPPEVSIRAVAVKFFSWLRDQLVLMENGLPFAVDDARVRICVPALEQPDSYISIFGEILAAAGWKNRIIVKATEPIANTVGYATQGRNAGITDGPDFGSMFHESGSFMTFINQTTLHNFGATAHLVILDVGSFTSDLSVIKWEADLLPLYMQNVKQVSFRHGIIEQLDNICLPDAFQAAGINYEDLSFRVRENSKRALYHGQNFDLDGIAIGGGLIGPLINSAIHDFSENLINQIRSELGQIRPKWFLLTGGGSNIPGIHHALTNFFSSLGNGSNSPLIPTIIREDCMQVGGGNRNETSIGACSIYWDSVTDLEIGTGTRTGTRTGTGTGAEGEGEDVNGSIRVNCPCHNPNCFRCDGRGWYLRTPISRIKTRVVERPLRQSSEHIQLWRPDFHELFKMNFFTLEGWMGELVFGTKRGAPNHNYSTFRIALESEEGNKRKESWYRLLCLSCLLGVRARPLSIRTFWKNELDRSGFWENTVDSDRRFAALDDYFIKLIHRNHKNVHAAGERADFHRRVFYDFRKIYHLIYKNDFDLVIREILDSPENPIRFLRSGWLSDQSPWSGVIGQSITTPLLFLMRELRRMGVITTNRVDDLCHYMNGPAIRAASQRGWLNKNQNYSKSRSFEETLEASRTVHKRMLEECDILGWDTMWFDIPLQILGHEWKKPL